MSPPDIAGMAEIHLKRSPRLIRSRETWTTAVDTLPAVDRVVVVCQKTTASYRVFVGWLDESRVWRSFFPDRDGVAQMGDLLAEDCWIPLPDYRPTDIALPGLGPE